MNDDTSRVPARANDADHPALLQLLRQQSEEAIRFSAVFGERHGLHQTDVAALAAIAQAAAADAPLGPAALAGTLHLSRPATTALLDRLEHAGHIVRRPDPTDRRRTTVELQPAASELAAAFFGPLGAAYEQAMRRYSAKDLRIVAAFIQDIIDATVTTRSRLAETAD